jgi:phosphoribosylamine--glycine ligase
VVLAAAGYPDSPRTGDEISGLAEAEACGATVFHAGTQFHQGKLVTAGGRVLGITAQGPTLAQAIETAYRAVARVHFDGMHYRKDIGFKGLSRYPQY